MNIFTSIIVILISLIICYLIGSINTGIIVSHFTLKDDVRKYGSGGSGTTNVLRTSGTMAGVYTLAGDCLKGIISVCIGKYIVYNLFFKMGFTGILGLSSGNIMLNLFSPIGLGYLCGIACIIGHVFPIYFGFKGGKGVATSLGVMFLVDWRSALVGASVFIVIMLITRIVSFGSIIAALCVPISSLIILLNTEKFSLAIFYTVLSCAVPGILISMHRKNIVRLVRGEEKPLQFTRKGKRNG